MSSRTPGVRVPPVEYHCSRRPSKKTNAEVREKLDKNFRENHRMNNDETVFEISVNHGENRQYNSLKPNEKHFSLKKSEIKVADR
jgi:hypothetical protein